MATKDSKMSIAVEEGIVRTLSQLAEQERKTVSDLAMELIMESLERREDMFFLRLPRSEIQKRQKG